MTVTSIQQNGDTYDVKTDLDPTMVTLAGQQIFKRWVEFAMGRAAIGGKVLMHPTGQYASSIRFRQTGVSSVSIMTLDRPLSGRQKRSIADIIEHGHDAFDMKTLFAQGKVFSMHRGDAGDYGSAGYGAPRRNQGAYDKRKNIWASIRGQGSSGYARLGMTGWVIPPMPAYAPAAHLVELFQQGDFHDV